MNLLGLTGGIGMGKSTAAKLLHDLGAAVVDTDVLARTLVEPGQPALSEIQQSFGPRILAPDGTLSRSELARLVFADATARKKLESILHPLIRDAWTRQVAQWRQGSVAIAAVVIPLLYETQAADSFDATVCVTCSRATQLDRLRARHWTHEQITQRINAQWPIEKKVEASDFVTWAEGPLTVHSNQLKLILQTITS